jgi:hypothetical protein
MLCVKSPSEARYKWAEAGELSDVTVVIVGAKMTLVTRHRDFDLGVVRTNELCENWMEHEW